MRRKSSMAMLTIASLAISLGQLPVANGALTALILIVNPATTQNAYGSNASNVAVEVDFLSTSASDEHLKLSANLVSSPAGQSPQATITQVASTNATLEMFDSTAHIKAVNTGVVNAKFLVSIKSSTNTPLAAGTYALNVFAGSSSGSERQSVAFVISPPPAPTLSPSLSKIWMAPGATPASESNNNSSISVPANLDLKNQVVNLTVDLRDSNNSQMNDLPVTVTVTGVGILGIGSNASSNTGLGRAVVGQAGQYAISVFSDGLYGNSTITIFQNGQLIGSKSLTFTQAAPQPSSIIISNVSIDKLSVSAGESFRVQFTTKTTSLPTGQIPVVLVDASEDCDGEDCSVPGAINLVSGNSSNGTWSGIFQFSKLAVSANYSIRIYFPKLKGTPGFYYTHPEKIVLKGIDPPPPAPPASASMSILSSNNKTVLSIGETFIVKIGVKTSNFPQGIPISATIFTADDCEEGGCSSGAVGKLVSGTLENGIWEIAVPIHNQMLSGRYSMNYGFFKLKGTPGVFGASPDYLSVQGVTTPPVPLPATINISNIRPSSTSLKAGNLLEVQFDLATTNIGANEVIQVYLTDDSSENCEEGCGFGSPKLIKGSLANGSWTSEILIPNSVPTGNYSLVVSIPKRKGLAGAYSVYKQPIYITGAPKFTPVYVFSAMKTSAKDARVGQTVTGFFLLKTNDEKVSTPACIIDGIAGWSNAILVKGTLMEGSWECKLAIPSDAITGNYKFTVAVVGYANGSKNEERADLGTLAVSGTALVQSATSQQCQKYLNTFSTNWSSINYGIEDVRISLSDPKYSENFFIGKFTNWTDLYKEKYLTVDGYLIEAQRLLTLASSNEVVSCDFYVNSKGLSDKYSVGFGQLLSSLQVLNTALMTWYKNMQSLIPDPMKYFNAQIGTDILEVQQVSEKVVGKVQMNFAYQSSTGVAKILCSSNSGKCGVSQNGQSSEKNTYYGVVEIDSVPPGTFLNVTLTQLDSTGNPRFSSTHTYTTLRVGLRPSIGPVTSLVGGCSFKILNYDPLFTWFAKSEMKIARDGTSTIFTGSMQGSDEYLSTSRAGYQTINALETLFKCLPLNSSSGLGSSNGNVTSEVPVLTIDDEGTEEAPSATLRVKKENSGKYLLGISSNLSEEKVTLTASRKGRATIRFSATTNEDGAVQIRTSRNLSGYSVKLLFDGEVLKNIKVA